VLWLRRIFCAQCADERARNVYGAVRKEAVLSSRFPFSATTEFWKGVRVFTETGKPGKTEKTLMDYTLQRIPTRASGLAARESLKALRPGALSQTRIQGSGTVIRDRKPIVGWTRVLEELNLLRDGRGLALFRKRDGGRFSASRQANVLWVVDPLDA